MRDSAIMPHDLESAPVSIEKEDAVVTEQYVSSSPEAEVARTRQLQNTWRPFRALNQGEQWLDRKLGIETHGVDRIPEDARKPPSLLNCFFIWCSVTCHVAIVPIGVLGPEFGLNMGQSAAAIFVGSLLGSMCAAYCSILGPKTGLRAVATARYSFGFHGAKICSILNVIVAGGFGMLNVVLTGQTLSAVSDYRMSTTVGCVTVSVISYLLSVFGFKLVHALNKYAWIVSFILLSVLLGQAGSRVSAPAPAQLAGPTLAGIWLTFMAINFSAAAGWCSFAADYYCHYHTNTKSWKVFTLTTWGITIPLVFTTMVGVCIANAALNSGYAPYASAYETYHLGGLIHEIYHPEGWSKFCLVILTFSTLGNNVVISYSSGLSIQLLGDIFHAVPRFIWSFLVTFVIAVLAIAGSNNLSGIVSNFVSMLGYWAVSFTVILFFEHEWFRKGHPEHGYDLSAWDDAKRLPVGVAAVVSLLAGYLGGGLMGMAQVWWTGPVAAKFGPYGGDVGIYLSAVITTIVYPVTRYLERKYIGR